jgi:ElaB/YqjD/DUF883 family membrane-anchored ribosome-binding protein
MEVIMVDSVDEGAASAEAAVDAAAEELKGNVRQFQAKAQEVRVAVNEAIGKAADTVAATAVKVGDQAKDAYGAATERVQQAADMVDPLVKEQPYVALGLAAVAGLLLGMMLGRGPRVIYVKSRS